MSGPKTSKYTLTAEQRRILAEQRKLERRKAIATESIKLNKKKLAQMREKFSGEAMIAEELSKRAGSDGGFNAMLNNYHSVIDSKKDITINQSASVEELESVAKALADDVKKAEGMAREISATALSNKQQLHTNLQQSIDRGFGASFVNLGPKESSLDTLKESLLSQIDEVEMIDNLSGEQQEKLSGMKGQIQEAQSETHLKNYAAITVVPTVKDYLARAKEYEQCHEEYEALYSEYIALCELHYYVAQEYSCSVESIESLREEISRIKEIAAEEEERRYINSCLDEVMRDMGYDVIGVREVSKRSGKRFKNELFTYSDGTVVNVTFSSDGRIAMELGGVDNTDRLPSEGEVLSLCDAMNDFCEEFRVIEKKLAEKGVVVGDRISLLPPDAEYAQIINTTDYEMSADIKITSEKKKRQALKAQRMLSRE